MTRIYERFYFRDNGLTATRTFDLDKPVDVVRIIARDRYAWPGGYELLAVMDDGALVCSGCLHENYREILTDTKKGWNTGWRVVGYTTDDCCEKDNADYCAHCNKPLFDEEL